MVRNEAHGQIACNFILDTDHDDLLNTTLAWREVQQQEYRDG